LKKNYYFGSYNQKVIFFFKFVEKCQISNASYGYLMYINEIISVFLYEKDIYFLKLFYNSLISKKIILLLSIRDSAILEEAKSL